MRADGSTAYDTVAYPSRCYPQTHPDRLATLATLFGMSPAPVEGCRVLELGCGEGRNLLDLAFALPGSEFVGVDLAARAIAKAEEEACALGLSNVEFHAADLMDWSPPGGPFDYVIAHGLIAWVPEFVCRRAFVLCRDRLAPQGVAFVSYNARPGFHLRAMLREMMQFHTRHINDPKEKVAQAKAFLNLLLMSGDAADNVATEAAKGEARSILKRESDELLFHDDLAELSRPFAFHEIAALAVEHGLQYLAEADFFEMQDAIFPPPVAGALRQLDDVVMKEQYLDFLKCRRFRQTLLCRDGVTLDRAPGPGLMRRFLVASKAKAESTGPDLGAGVPESFVGPIATMRVDDPLTKAALLELPGVWPRALAFEELVDAARRRLGRSGSEDRGDGAGRLAEALLAAYSGGMAELHVWQPPWESARGGRPVLSPLARSQLERGQEVVTSLSHTNRIVNLPIMRAIFLLLDGTRDLAAVAAEVGRRLDAGELELPPGATRESMPEDLARSVRDAAAGGLLLAWEGEATDRR